MTFVPFFLKMCCNLRLKLAKNHARPLHCYTQCCISHSVIWTGKIRQSTDTYPQIVIYFCCLLDFYATLQIFTFLHFTVGFWTHRRQVSRFNVLGSKRYKAGWHRNTRPGLLDLYNVTRMVSQHVQFLFIANFRKQRGLFNFLKKKTKKKTFIPFLS